MSSIPLNIRVESMPWMSDFFRYHGVWAPGVRLFRNLRFRTKAMIVSLVLLLLALPVRVQAKIVAMLSTLRAADGRPVSIIDR